ncbi:hypothetical protein [Providencia sneebia]|uniref:Fimbrial protein n=1 Tax=Providencia sneebia DSM 19967 TaxID=1141660 RepID=K8WSF1_9GAMM|nr:hypothetical protein [Providencia sneebia]EKT60347.1 hypothetical protein OO7_03475 [Providencia sneebia DSM 19967]
MKKFIAPSSTLNRCHIQNQPNKLMMSVLFGAVFFLCSSAFATDYIVFPGSMMKLTTIDGTLSGGVDGTITLSKYSLRMSGGGLTTEGNHSSVCQPAVTVNGYTGIAAVNGRNDVVVGVTGTSTGAKVNIGLSDADVRAKRFVYDIDGVWDSYGKLSSSTASTASMMSNCLYPKGAPTSGNIHYGGAGNTKINNVPAVLDLTIWAYIGPDVPYGTYPLKQIFFNQGTSITLEKLIASKQVLSSSDRLIVQAPPCTIGIGNTSVVFNNLATSPNMSESIADTLSINCAKSIVSASVYVRATAITGTATSDGYGFGLVNSETQKSNVDGTGIIVRGGIGPNPVKTCTYSSGGGAILFDPASRLPGFYVALLSNYSSTDRTFPVQWYACTTANTLPGKYTGSATLGFTYR